MSKPGAGSRKTERNMALTGIAHASAIPIPRSGAGRSRGLRIRRKPVAAGCAETRGAMDTSLSVSYALHVTWSNSCPSSLTIS